MIMALLLILASITLTATLLAVPGLAPYVHAFVSVAKYPAYAYYIWQYAPSVLRRLLLLDAVASRVARLSRVYHSGLRSLAPHTLPYTAFAVSRWALWNIVAFTGLCACKLAGSGIFADYRHKIIELGISVRSGVRDWFNPLVLRLSTLRKRAVTLWSHVLDRYVLSPCLQFALTVWPCTLSHAMICAVMSEFDISLPANVWPTISSLPLTALVGLLTLIVLWRCALKTISLVGLGVEVLSYAYFAVVWHLASAFFSTGLGYLVLFGLSLDHLCGVSDISYRGMVGLMKCTILAFSLHEDILAQRLSELSSSLRTAFQRCTYRLVQLGAYVCIALLRLSLRIITYGSYLLLRHVARTILKLILGPVVRRIIYDIICWTSMVCAKGCIIAAAAAIKLFAALPALLYYANLLVHPQYTPSQDNASVFEPPTLPLEYYNLSTVSPEGSPSAPTPTPSHSPPVISDGVRRLGLLINAYLDESVSGESVIELENQFQNTRSMHAPPRTQATPPPTPLFPVPSTPAPAPASPTPPPVSPVDSTLTPMLTPDLSFESSDEDEEVSSLATRLSSFHIESGPRSVPREPQCVSPRAAITFGAFNPLSSPGPVIPARERRTTVEMTQGAVAWFYLEPGVGRTVL
ncbi:hypothetical protein RhiJN_21703 [Ceratobasidium sp. AG-Ba]|nr:hypothetical protein RhiJN_21703 [Ceratobasidium sp. AG-Ba]